MTDIPDYPPLLSEWFPRPPDHGHPGTKSSPAIGGQQKKEFARRLDVLLEHFSIDLDDDDKWYRLACCLAVTHIRGFQQEPRGKDREWTASKMVDLYRDVERMRHDDPELNEKRKKPLTINKACGLLACTDEYCDHVQDTLRAYYNRAKSNYAGVIAFEGNAERRNKRPYPVIDRDRDSVDAPGSAAEAERLIRELIKKL